MTGSARPRFAALVPLLPLLLLACCGGGGSGAAPRLAGDPPAPLAAPVDAEGNRAGHPGEEALRAVAERTVSLLAGHEFHALADLVHPERGVRFSPYAYVEPEVHPVLHPEELRAAAGGEDPVRLWGYEDGTGDPIRLPLSTYVERWVADAPFLEEGEVTIDRRRSRGNTIDNAAEVYPDARIVEYHVPGTDPRYAGMDWKSLRLAFVPHRGAWRLVAVVHDEWTI